MLAEIGQNLLTLSLVVSLYAAFAAFWGVQQRDSRWARSAQRGLIVLAILLGVALLLLLSAFLSNDFSVRYVAQHSSNLIPVYLKVSAVWAGQEGSLLLWCFLQALFAALATARPSEKARALVPWASVFLCLITAFFVAVTLFLSNPFDVLPQPLSDGQGLNPLLRHPGMIFHPPALYVGYVGLAVPFAFAMAALVTRKFDGWTAGLRTWTLITWLGLGLGLLLGMRWAYDVLGWGGYWGWDPVENAGLLPWFTATALLHGGVMQEEKRGFRVWNLVLVIFSFFLVLFGTFATRSGMIQSVHAYPESNLGSFFLAAIAVTLVGSFGLLYSRRRELRSQQSFESLLSRDGMFFLTLALLSMLTVSVFIGTVLPTITSALLSQRFEAGPAWFDQVTGPQFGVLVLVIGLCPLLGRAAATLRRLRANLWLLVLGAVLAPTGAAIAGFTDPISLVGFSVVGLAGVVTLAELVTGTVARARRTGEAPLNALWGLFRQQRRKYGGYLVHVGVVLMAVGIMGTRLYPFEEERSLQLAQPVTVERYTLVYEQLQQELVEDHTSTSAVVSVYRDGEYLAGLQPRLNRYLDSDQSLTVPALRPGIREDLYLILSGWSDDGNVATFKIVINSLVNFLWLGGLVLLAGGALAVCPQLKTPLGNSMVLLTGAALLVGAGWTIWGVPHGMITDGVGRALVGQPAPDFRLTLLDGSSLSLQDLHGKAVVVNFWASWCPPCKDEMPDLQESWETYGDRGVGFVGVAYQDELQAVEAALAEFGTTYPVGVDEGDRVAGLYGITGIPETFIVDQQGRVAYVRVGAVTAEMLSVELDALLGSSDD